MNIYEELGLEPLINAAGTYTAVGGSRMSPGTLQAMAEAAAGHVAISELQERVQSRIAAMTRNEGAAVCNGAAAGLYICAAAAAAQKWGKKARYLSNREIAACEILSLNAQHIPYDYAVKQLGVTERRVGYPNIPGSMEIADLEAGINENTAAVYYFISSPYGLETPGTLPVEEVIRLGSARGVPVVIDAAAQLPPAENLWRFTEMGASAVIFSGGKYLRGPQSSGLILGKRAFMETVRETNFPHYGFGRMLKTGREEIVGLYRALEEFLAADPKEAEAFAESCVERLCEAFAESPLFRVERAFPNEAGQPLAFARVETKGAVTPDEIAVRMKEGTPSVFIKPEGRFFFINPMTLREEEILPVIEKMQKVEKTILKERNHVG